MRSFRKQLLLLALAPAISLSVANAQDLESMTLGDLLNVKVQSASKEAEPWSEAPVPISVITADMMKKAGVRTLKEALIDFVPGYTNSQDRNEILFATRGIYATSQQKVLIMINGHRINSRAYEAGMPDYGIDLQNIERIEVLRGPGSSLYGNVALAGVINLITKKGKDVNGTSVDVSAGNYGQRRVRFLTGSGDNNYDFLGWGQYYTASGEKHHVVAGSEKYDTAAHTGDIYLDRVNEPAAHDVGMTYKHGNWSWFGASRTSSYGEPYGGNDTYSLPDYKTFHDMGPGLMQSQEHLGVKYDGAMSSSWSFEANPYYDSSEVGGELANHSQGGDSIDWQDQDIGMTVQANHKYSKGNLLLGAQLETYKLLDSNLVSIVNGTPTTITYTGGQPLLEIGGESSYAAFFQEKHHFTKEWLVNAGARYDYKVRRSGPNYDNLSPRVALIYLPNSTWEHKLVYSQSFEDAPYWYRYNHFAPFSGSSSLDPELLSAVQYQNVWKSADKTKRNAVTVYYQNGKNLVTNHASDAQKYQNSGRIESMGLEEELAWQLNSFEIFWNAQYDYALSTVDYTRFDQTFAHVPNLASSLVVNYSWNKDVSANATVQYTGDEYYLAGTTKTKVDASTVLNLGGRYDHIAMSNWNLDARIYNVLNTTYYQGGQTGTQVPFLQPGMWWMLTAGYTF